MRPRSSSMRRCGVLLAALGTRGTASSAADVGTLASRMDNSFLRELPADPESEQVGTPSSPVVMSKMALSCFSTLTLLRATVLPKPTLPGCDKWPLGAYPLEPVHDLSSHPHPNPTRKPAA